MKYLNYFIDLKSMTVIFRKCMRHITETYQYAL